MIATLEVATTSDTRAAKMADLAVSGSHPGLKARLVAYKRIDLAVHSLKDMPVKQPRGVVWVNGTNMFDAACGFGGYRESGFGREGGREGMFEYLVAQTPYSAAIKPEAASFPAPAAAFASCAFICSC